MPIDVRRNDVGLVEHLGARAAVVELMVELVELDQLDLLAAAFRRDAIRRDWPIPTFRSRSPWNISTGAMIRRGILRR